MTTAERKDELWRVVGDHSVCPRCSPEAPADEPDEEFSAERKAQLEEWEKNKTVNPATKAKISVGGPTYRTLEKDYQKLQESTDPVAIARQRAEDNKLRQEGCRRISSAQSLWSDSFRIYEENLVICNKCDSMVHAKIVRHECALCVRGNKTTHCRCETVVDLGCDGCGEGYADRLIKHYPRFDAEGLKEIISFICAAGTVRFEPIVAKMAPVTKTTPATAMAPITKAAPVVKPVAAKPAPVVKPVAAKPAPVATKPAPVATKPAPVTAKPAPVAAKPASAATKPAPVATKPAGPTTIAGPAAKPLRVITVCKIPSPSDDD